ncbi:MAG: hypothetical protein AB8B87_05945 [Granulosicoccus sp.]
MHSDELRTAVIRIGKLLNQSGIRTAVDQFRLSKGDQRTAAAARLSHAGAVLADSIDSMSPDEKKVVKCLHLESLGSPDYWQQLLATDKDPKERQGEIVRLASRVMFASSHLPTMLSLMDSVHAAAVPTDDQSSVSNALLHPVEEGEGALFIRLTDAGERASDPDRVARAIDGIDMLYSACASIARKPAIDLRLDNIAAKLNRDRDFRFTGEKDSVAAVFAVIDSIPAALADIDPEQDIDLDSVVRSLPIFQDLNTLASLGTFSGKDLKDISETMHQGALLTLESGVILIDEEMVGQGETLGGAEIAPAAIRDISANSGVSDSSQSAVLPAASAAEGDEHYNRYLREREAMLRPQSPAAADSANGNPASGLSGVFAAVESGTEDQSRKEAVDELLKSLGQTRTS